MANILGKKVFGVDISDYSIEILQLTSKKEVKFFNRVKLERGIVEDGFILNKEKLAEKLKSILKDVPSERVILSIPESKSFIHVFKAPAGLKKNEMKSVIESEIEKTLPLKIDDMYWDWKLIPKEEKEKKQTIFFIGTLKKVVDDYIEVFKSLNLEVLAVEIESLALGRALLQGKKYKNSVMILDIGARTTNISIFNKEGVLEESDVISIAGSRLTQALSEEMKISLKEAEEVKIEDGVMRGKSKKILAKEFDIIIERIKKIIDYYNKEIEEIVLVGGTSELPGLLRYLSSKTGFKTTIGVSPVVKRLNKKSVLFNVVAGLALRAIEKDPEIGLNLLPKKVKKDLKIKKPKMETVEFEAEEKPKRSFPLMKILILLIIVVILGWAVYNFVLKEPEVKESPPEEEVPEEEVFEKEGEISGVSVVPAGEGTTSEEEIEPEPVKVNIKQTETGWLNVRKGPDTTYSIITKIYPGESYPLLAETENWYKIEITDGEEGWISARYADIVE